MTQNHIRFREDYSIADLHREYGAEKQCEQALFNWRWPKGFICPECGFHRYSNQREDGLLQCNYCHHESSLKSGTIFEKSNLSLTTWFLGIHLLTQSEVGFSAMKLKGELGVSYPTAWVMKYKIMRVIKGRDDLIVAREFTWINTYDWQYKRCHDSYLPLGLSRLYVPGAKVSGRISGGV